MILLSSFHPAKRVATWFIGKEVTCYTLILLLVRQAARLDGIESYLNSFAWLGTSFR